jgi:hypothetical protein
MTSGRRRWRRPVELYELVGRGRSHHLLTNEFVAVTENYAARPLLVNPDSISIDLDFSATGASY